MSEKTAKRFRRIAETMTVGRPERETKIAARRLRKNDNEERRAKAINPPKISKRAERLQKLRRASHERGL